MTQYGNGVARSAICIAFAAVVSLFATAGAQAQNFEPLQTFGAKEAELTPQQGKMSSVIRGTIARLNSAGVNRSVASSLATANNFSGPFLRIDENARVQLYLELNSIEATQLAALNPSGRTQIDLVNNDLKIVQAWVPFDEIESMAALNFVTRIRPPEYSTLRIGSVTTQGDAILKTDVVRSSLSYTGFGVKVGVISDGANNASLSQATGDLPPNITSFGTCSTASGTTCNEGTAIMEIIYDLAPGVTVAMGDALTSLDFIQRVTDLKNWGAKVIVDDIGFFTQPYFEDGSVAAAYASAVSQGIVVISAAGNEAQGHYQGLYNDLNGIHNFGGGDITMNFSGGPGAAAVILQWSDKFGAAVDDYDLCITDPSGAITIACSENIQSGTQDPVEAVSVSCSNAKGCTGGIAVLRFSGAPQTLELFVLGAAPTEHVVSADSIFGQAAAPGVISVGAIAASDPGNMTIEPYSSRGASTIAFPAPVVRPTPTVATVDCVSVTGAGGFPKNFCGTSAAGPHAAGVAAILLQANPSLVPSQVASLLQSTAADRGSAGFDNTYGAGIADALAAATASQSNLPPAISSLSPASVTRGGAALTLTVNGLAFTPNSVLKWNGSNRPTNVLGYGQLTAQIPATDLASAGAPQLTVFTPAPGGGTSGAASFTVNNPTPAVSSVSPATTLIGSPAFVLTVNGSNFVPESVVRWNASNRPTTFVGANQLTAQISASDLASARTDQVTVFSPVPGGGTTAGAPFVANNPAPTVAGLLPFSVPARSTTFALTVNGTNFVSGSVVRWNGSSRTTSFLNSTQVVAIINASDVATPGTSQITVFSTTPGGGTSSAIPFSITPPVPVPAFTTASLVNSASFTGAAPAPGSIASLFGTNLASAPVHAQGLPLLTTLGGTSVRLNNIPAPLLFVSPTQIDFQVPWELAGLTQATLTVTADLAPTPAGAIIPEESADADLITTSPPVVVSLSPQAPGIFSINSQGTGQGAVVISNTSTFVAPTGSIPGAAARPAARGEFITIYGTGLGAVSNPPATGAAAGSNSTTTAAAVVTIGGVQVPVPSFSGLAPGFAGLYQIDVPVPNSAPSGSAVPVTVSIRNVPSNAVTIAIQ